MKTVTMTMEQFESMRLELVKAQVALESMSEQLEKEGLIFMADYRKRQNESVKNVLTNCDWDKVKIAS